MLSTHEIEELFERQRIPQNGRDLIQKVRSGDPVRSPMSRSRNSIVTFFSNKMGKILRVESSSLEYPGAFFFEGDSSIKEYYPQPLLITLEKPASSPGPYRKYRHTPDFLSISQNDVKIHEWKREEVLTEKSQKDPSRFRQDMSGLWRDLPTEEYFLGLGIHYKIHTEKDVPRILFENLKFLRHYHSEISPDLTLDNQKKIVEIFQENPSIYLSELFNPEYEFSADEIFTAISRNYLVADLSRDKLADPDNCVIYRDWSAMELARLKDAHPSETQFILEDKKIKDGDRIVVDNEEYFASFLSSEIVILRGKNGNEDSYQLKTLEKLFKEGHIQKIMSGNVTKENVKSLSMNASKEEMDVAIKRFEILNDQNQRKVSERTISGWRRLAKEAENQGLSPVFGLIPKFGQRGNRKNRIDLEITEIMDEVIKKEFLTFTAKNRIECYRKLLEKGKERDLEIPTYQTFCTQIRKIERVKRIQAREGHRSAYQSRPMNPKNYFSDHGSRPFEKVYIDHTQLDIEILSGNTEKNLGKPWITVAIDGFSRRILGFYLAFHSPSYVSNMMVLRDIVSRFQRLPEYLGLDNGTDFRSKDFIETFCRIYQVVIINRPPAEPRSGAVIERFFGTLNSGLVHNLDGNTKITRKPRSVTKSNDPKRLAKIKASEFYRLLDSFLMEIYDQRNHSGIGLSPRSMFEKGVRETGLRDFMKIPYDEAFFINTLPFISRLGERKIDPQRGIKFLKTWYWTEAFRSPRNEKARVKVKVDPWNIGHVYAYVDKCWQECTSRVSIKYAHLSVKAMKILSQELIERQKNISSDLFEIIESSEMKEKVMNLQDKEDEMRAFNHQKIAPDSGMQKDDGLPENLNNPLSEDDLTLEEDLQEESYESLY